MLDGSPTPSRRLQYELNEDFLTVGRKVFRPYDIFSPRNCVSYN